MGGYGSENGKFDGPYGVAVDAAGNIYVADSANNRIQKFNSSGGYVDQWGGYGTGNGDLWFPVDVAVDAAGNVYVAEYYNNRIQKFDSGGGYLDQWGIGGSGNGEFNHPNGVAVDTAGNVYVADTDNNRIQKFDSSGSYLTQWGIGGSGNGEFNDPNGVAVDTAGKVYVADSGNNRIQKFDSGGSYLAQWGSYGTGNGEFHSPPGVAVDAAGNVYVSDKYNRRVQKFDSSGGYLTQWGGSGSGDGEFGVAYAVAVNAAGKVYVSDIPSSLIQVFTPGLSTVLDDSQNDSFTVDPGSYLVSELVPAGWLVADIHCYGGSPTYGATTATVTLAAEDDVTCAFSNVATGSIQVVKTVAGSAPAGDWSFTGSDPIGAFTLPASGGSKTIPNLTPGSFTITETDIGGWVPAASCAPGNETGANSVIVAVVAGEEAVCTFTNTQCQPGTFDDGTACTPAPAGRFVDSAGATAATPCAAGSFQPATGQTSCLLAEPGYYVPGEGATVQTPCPAGETSGAGATACEPVFTSFCPAGGDTAVGFKRTDVLGTGQGNTKSGVRTRKLVIPDYRNLAALYGQLAGVESGGVMKYVRFRYPHNTYEQIKDPTSRAYRTFAVNWWGSELDTGYKYVKGQFFWGAKGNKQPRAFVLWPTYNTTEEYANVFVTFDESSENHVAWEAGFIPTQTQIIDIPETQTDGATVVVRLAIVDNNKDARPLLLDVTVGPETQSNADTVPNRKDTLNIYEFTFENVGAGVNQVTIDLTSPAPSELYSSGGDSAALIGAAVSYACALPVVR